MSTRGNASGPKRMLLICGLRGRNAVRRWLRGGRNVCDDEQGTHRMSQVNIIESGGGAVCVLSAEQADGGEKGEPLEEVFD